MTYSIIPLSGQSSSKPIQITTNSAGSAITLHTAVNNGADYDEVELFVNNHTGTDCEVVILIGGTSAAEEVRKTIPANDTKLVLAGYRVEDGQTVKAYATTANSLNAFGKVGRTVA